MMFTIIKFISDNVYEVVPYDWMTEDKCWWPPTNEKKAIMKQATPDLSTWVQHAAVVVKVKDSWLKATQKMALLMRTDIDTEEALDSTDNERRKMKPNRYMLQCASSCKRAKVDLSFPSQYTSPPIPLSLKPKSSAPHSVSVQPKSPCRMLPDHPFQSPLCQLGEYGSHCWNFESSSPLLQNNQSSGSQLLLRSPDPHSASIDRELQHHQLPLSSSSASQSCVCCKHMLKVLQDLTNANVTMTAQLRVMSGNTMSLQNELQLLRQQVAAQYPTADFQPFPMDLPCRGQADFNDLLEHLQVEATRDALVRQLLLKCGQTVKQSVKGICRAIFADSVAACLNLDGKGTKKKFGIRDTLIMKVIFMLSKRIMLLDEQNRLTWRKTLDRT